MNSQRYQEWLSFLFEHDESKGDWRFEYDVDDIDLSKENVVGFITDGSAMGVGLGVPAFTGSADGGVEVATSVDDGSGIGIQLRRHYDRATGGWYLNAVILYGNAVVRTESLTRLVSA